MKPFFQPMLVNDAFGDPVLYVDFLYDRRAVLFDLGEIHALPAKKILRISHIFVSHTHMDHFVGFDFFLRVCLGRGRTVHLYGPEGFIARVEHKLSAYTWNLVEHYEEDFALVAHDVLLPEKLVAARFRCRDRFRREDLGEQAITRSIVADEPGFCVRAVELDHRVACLGYCFEEKIHVNIWKNRLEEQGLPPGPWLKELKDAVVAGKPDDTPFHLCWADERGNHDRIVRLGQLRETVLQVVPGQKIGFVTDVSAGASNVQAIEELVRGVDRLFIETFFLHEDEQLAARAFHLTARQAGEIAHRAGVSRMTPMHVSPRYQGRYREVEEEARAAFEGSTT